MNEELKKLQSEFRKINRRIVTLIQAGIEVPQELYDRVSKLEELIKQCKNKN